VHKIASGNAEVLEFVVDENTKHIGEKLKDMPIQKNVLIASISSGRTTEIAHGDMTFHAGDTVVIVASSDHVIGTLNDIFGE
jgi:trk system potassium uptake protein TrkA